MISRTRFRVASALTALGLLYLPLSVSATTIDVNSLLTGPGFNSGDPPLQSWATTPSNVWLDENAALVTGSENGVSPLEGDGMLRIMEAGGCCSQVRQVFPVAVSPGDDAVLRYSFNSPTAGSGAAIILRAYGPGVAGAGAIQLGLQSTGTVFLDADPLTWENLDVGTFVLPAGTVQLWAEVLFSTGTIPSFGYVDAIPEPSSSVLLAMGLVLMARKGRRTKT